MSTCILTQLNGFPITNEKELCEGVKNLTFGHGHIEEVGATDEKNKSNVFSIYDSDSGIDCGYFNVDIVANPNKTFSVTVKVFIDNKYIASDGRILYKNLPTVLKRIMDTL